jgi:tRNA(Ile)-lysidine synthase
MTHIEKQWHSLEHQVYRQFQSQNLSKLSLILMVSGGADSMALLSVFHELQSALSLNLMVLHCHHGRSSDLQQQNFRDEAVKFVNQICEAREIKFVSRKSETELFSESQFREFRKKCSQDLRQQMGFDDSLWAHQQDDFVETQFLRLIRGVSPQNLFEPMQFRREAEKEIRPFLHVSRQEIIAYLKHKKIQWLDDPSNQSQDPLRNWLRLNWLPQLEVKCPGALKSLSRSLDLLQETHSQVQIPDDIWCENSQGLSLSRSAFLALNELQKKQVLAQYLRRLGQREFSQNQLNEVLRQLDISQLNHTFKAAARKWSVNRDLIRADHLSIVGPVRPIVVPMN